MSKPLPSQNTFAGLSPPWSLTNLDANFTAVWNALNDYGTFILVMTDTGAVNAMVCAPAAGLTWSLVDGQALDVIVGNTTTSTTPTLNVNGTGAKTVVNADNSALVVGQLVAGMRVRVIYDLANTVYRIQSQTVGLPTIKGTLTVTGPSNATTVVLNPTATNHGLQINPADLTPAFYVNGLAATQLAVLQFLQSGQAQWQIYEAASTSDLRIYDGNDRLVLPAGSGIQARGPTAAALVDMTPDKSSFTGTFVGITGSPTGTVNWVRVGNLVIVFLPNIGPATSTSISLGMTGIPAAITPTTTKNATPCGGSTFIDNGAAVAAVDVQVTSAGAFNFYKNGNLTGWTASGNKAIQNNPCIMYSLN